MVRAFEPPVYCYHEIVHNRLVVERFREQGVVFVDDVDEVPPGAPLMLSAHGSAPEVVAAASARRPLRRERGVPARHQGAPRGEGARPQGLHDPLRRPRRPRRGRRHARGRARAIRLRRARGATSTSVLARGRRSANASRCSRRRRSRTTSGPDMLDAGPRTRSRELWTASRNDLCFATTNRQAALTAIATARRRGRRDRQRELVEHDRARRRSRADAGCPIVLRVDGPDELDLDALGDATIVGVTAGASAPEDLVEAVIAEARTVRRRRGGARHRRGRVLPAAARAARADPRARRASPRSRSAAIRGTPARPADRSPTTAALDASDGARRPRPVRPRLAPRRRRASLGAQLARVVERLLQRVGQLRGERVDLGARHGARRPRRRARSARRRRSRRGRSAGTSAGPAAQDLLGAGDPDRHDRHAGRSARYAAPGCSGWIFGPFWRVPSGNTTSRSPACSIAIESRSALRSVPSRSTGNPPSAREERAEHRDPEQRRPCP